MRGRELFERWKAIHHLGTTNKDWAPVYRSYLTCIGLIILVSLVQAMIDFLVISMSVLLLVYFGSMVWVFWTAASGSYGSLHLVSHLRTSRL